MSKFQRLGLLIRKNRLAKKLTQLELSKHFGYGSSQFISNWERGDCGPPLNALPLLSELLEINQSEIIRIIVDETKHELELAFLQKSRAVKKSRG